MRRTPRTRRALCLVAAFVVSIPLWLPTPGGAQAVPPPPDPNDEEAQLAQKPLLDVRLAQLRGELSVLDDKVTRQGGEVAQYAAIVGVLDTRLDAVKASRADLAQRREGPDIVRREAALALYTRGDPSTKLFLDFLNTGKLSLAGESEAMLFRTAAEDAQAQVRVIDQDDTLQAKEQVGLEIQRGTADADRAARQAELQVLTTQRTALAAEQDDLTRRVQQILAIAPRGPLTGLAAVIRRPALAVKIDNHPEARPQSGLNGADVVFEELVEGGLTRFIAVFHSNDAGRVGPVRSGRTSDLELLANLNGALFGASGGNDGVLSALRQANLISVIENDLSSAYFRDEGREAPHNLYSRTASLWSGDRGRGGQPPPYFVFRKEGVASPIGQPTRGVSVRVGNEAVGYTWNGKGWQRSVQGQDEKDKDGTAIAPANVVVQFSEYGISFADAQSPEVLVTGSGTAWVLTDGKLIEGSWTRPAKTAVTRFIAADGSDIRLSPGSTWISLPRPGAASVLG